MRKTVLVSAQPAEPSQDEAGLPRTLKESRDLGSTKSLARAVTCVQPSLVGNRA